MPRDQQQQQQQQQKQKEEKRRNPIIDAFIKYGAKPKSVINADTARTKSLRAIVEQSDHATALAVQRMLNGKPADVESEELVKFLSDWDAVIEMMEDIMMRIGQVTSEGGLRLDYVVPTFIPAVPINDQQFVFDALVETLKTEYRYRVTIKSRTRREITIEWSSRETAKR